MAGGGDGRKPQRCAEGVRLLGDLRGNEAKWGEIYWATKAAYRGLHHEDTLLPYTKKTIDRDEKAAMSGPHGANKGDAPGRNQNWPLIGSGRSGADIQDDIAYDKIRSVAAVRASPSTSSV